MAYNRHDRTYTWGLEEFLTRLRPMLDLWRALRATEARMAVDAGVLWQAEQLTEGANSLVLSKAMLDRLAPPPTDSEPPAVKAVFLAQTWVLLGKGSVVLRPLANMIDFEVAPRPLLHLPRPLCAGAARGQN